MIDALLQQTPFQQQKQVSSSRMTEVDKRLLTPPPIFCTYQSWVCFPEIPFAPDHSQRDERPGWVGILPSGAPVCQELRTHLHPVSQSEPACSEVHIKSGTYVCFCLWLRRWAISKTLHRIMRGFVAAPVDLSPLSLSFFSSAFKKTSPNPRKLNAKYPILM